MKKVQLGMDLGTTNSCVSVYIGGNSSKVITLKDGTTTIPSCVYMQDDGSFIVGREAYNHRYEVERACYSIKRHMGDPSYRHTFKAGNITKSLSAVEVSALIIQGALEQISHLYPKESIEGITITVPAAFSDAERRATKEAGEKAGLNVVSIINEPTSAALCYTPTKSETILVYDLGGGTFDSSIVEIMMPENDEGANLNFDLLGINLNNDTPMSVTATPTIRVVTSKGNPLLGGDDIDAELINIVVGRFNQLLKAYGYTKNLEQIMGYTYIEQLKLNLEKLKKDTLHNTPGAVAHYKVKLPSAYSKIPRDKAELVVTYADLERATKKVYDKTLILTKRILRNPKVARDSVTKIVLVGGSTKNEILRKFIENDFPNLEVSHQYNADEVVGQGASIQTAIALGNADKNVIDVAPHTVGIEIIREDLDGNTTPGVFLPLIAKDTPLPTVVNRTFEIENSAQNLIIRFFTTDSQVSRTRDCAPLGNLILERVDATTSRVDVKLTVNSIGILEVSVSDGKVFKNQQLCNIFGAEPSGVSKQPEKYKYLAKNARKWREQLTKLGVPFTPQLEEDLDAYANGDKTKGEAIKELIRINSSNEEVSIEKTTMFGMKDDSEPDTGITI